MVCGANASFGVKFFVDAVPVRQANWFGDVILDARTDIVFLCLGSNHRFGIYRIPADAKPRMEPLSNLPLSPTDSDNLLRSGLLTKDRIRAIAPPDPIWLHLPGIAAANLSKDGDDLRVSVTTAKELPSLILHYSLVTKQWSIEKGRDKGPIPATSGTPGIVPRSLRNGTTNMRWDTGSGKGDRRIY